VGGQRHSRPLYPREGDPVTIVEEAGWAPMPVWKIAENLAPTGIRYAYCPERSESQYRLNCSGSYNLIIIIIIII
jgi:hypothetical protein